MRAVVTRVRTASVVIEGAEVAAIGQGVLVLLGVAVDDTQADLDYIVTKVPHLRIFADAQGLMNRSVLEVGGAALVVSQFTLLADVRKGRRPSFIRAAPPEQARRMYEAAVVRLRESGLPVTTGVFQADMQVSSVNDGPVTIIVDSRDRGGPGTPEHATLS
jgi:D-tyrosyl-tRNA(Tyr) deacylase